MPPRKKQTLPPPEPADAPYLRADAWARSIAGTPYGSLTPTLIKE